MAATAVGEVRCLNQVRRGFRAVGFEAWPPVPLTRCVIWYFLEHCSGLGTSGHGHRNITPAFVFEIKRMPVALLVIALMQSL